MLVYSLFQYKFLPPLSLVILGNYTEFRRAVLWLSENLSFDVDARINLFEVSI